MEQVQCTVNGGGGGGEILPLPNLNYLTSNVTLRVYSRYKNV